MNFINKGMFIFTDEKPPRLVAEIMTSNFSQKEWQHNAHLIAASPRMDEIISDMYEALKQLMVDYQTLCERKPQNTLLQSRFNMAKQALAKVEVEK